MNLSQSPPPTITASAACSSTHIRSFVHRRAHITPSQERALTQWLPRWSIPYQDAPVDLTQAFGRTAPVFLEIGFGMGETTAQIARARPDDDFLCVEVFNAGVGALLKHIQDEGIGNIRIVCHDAVEVLRNMLAPESLAGVHVYFPDPWPKKRHHKRRLIQPPFIGLLASRMAAGAYLHCATDWEPYATQMLEVLTAEPALHNTCNGFAPRPAWRPLTKFESRGLQLGHSVHDLVFTRRATALPALEIR